MIVVFVVDTSPSMGQRLSGAEEAFTSRDRSAGSGMSRLDLAKMAVESLTKGLTKRVIEHNNQLQQLSPATQKSLHNMGLGFCPTDQFLLLSTGRQYPQHPAVSSCGAGGRLLVGYGEYVITDQTLQHPGEATMPHGFNVEGFQKELKGLQATVWHSPTKITGSAQHSPFPEDGRGAEGLNAALSVGLQLLSRYRLKNRSTENFGMGRLPSPAMLTPSGGGHAVHALQPACLVLLTDGECLRKPPLEGGGTLKVQFGNMPLREFYKEPFRWDQRVFCLGVGGMDGVSSTQYLHSQLRALCEVTGGCHMMLRSPTSLSQVTDLLLRLIAPPRPRELPIPDPLRLHPNLESTTSALKGKGVFVNGGPVCCFQSLEATDAEKGGRAIHRAMLLYVPHQSVQPIAPPSDTTPNVFHPPTWCIPESFFPSKSLDTLPPRPAQPLLSFSRHPKLLGSKSFDPVAVMGALQKLDQMHIARSQASTQGLVPSQQNLRFLPRDVYVCEWLSVDGRAGKPPPLVRGLEYFPVLIQGAGRTLSDGDESFLNIGILHIPQGSSTLAYSMSTDTRFTSLTLLPPEPQILLPLLIKAAEAELRTIKKPILESAKEGPTGMGATAGLIQKQSGSGARLVTLDENWRNEFRAYLFRVPPYYQTALKRALRPILPTSVQSMLSSEGIDAVASQCFSKSCLQKIRNGEQIARETTEHLERQEAELRRRGLAYFESSAKAPQVSKNRWASESTTETVAPVIGYGQYDPRSTTERYLAALRNMPPPWRAGINNAKSNVSKNQDIPRETSSGNALSGISTAESKQPTVLEVLGDLPACCLLAYYESRRRWIFGGSGLTTRGLHVEGVNNDGCNSQRRKGNWSIDDEPLLSLAGVGASTMNQTTTDKMGNYRERLLWSRAPIVGYGWGDSSGVAATTAPDGSPRISVDDDAMPITFFDPKTGEFSDSVQARVRSRLLVNFGNPFKEKRGDSLLPEKFRSQSPPALGLATDFGPLTPPGSPPHDSFSGEGEGEAVFAVNPTAWKAPVRSTPSRKRDSSPLDAETPRSVAKKAKVEATGSVSPELLTKPKAPVVPPKPRNPPGVASRPAPPPPKPPQRKPPPPPPPSAAKKQSSEPQEDQKMGRAPPPPKPPPSAPKPEQKQSATLPPLQADMQSPEVKPKIDLPPGWICVWSKSQKRWYFFDTKSNRSVWQWPPPPPAAES